VHPSLGNEKPIFQTIAAVMDPALPLHSEGKGNGGPAAKKVAPLNVLMVSRTSDEISSSVKAHRLVPESTRQASLAAACLDRIRRLVS
jgi:hypothetical protein